MNKLQYNLTKRVKLTVNSFDSLQYNNDYNDVINVYLQNSDDKNRLSGNNRDSCIVKRAHQPSN